MPGCWFVLVPVLTQSADRMERASLDSAKSLALGEADLIPYSLIVLEPRGHIETFRRAPEVYILSVFIILIEKP